MNAYKKHLRQYASTETADQGTSSDADCELDIWFSEVVHGSDLRNRVAVTGFNISRGVFGSISTDLSTGPAANDEN